MKAQWVGLLPPEVKAKIAEHKKTFNDQIFIVAEPSNWHRTEKKVERPPSLVDPDPLLVGFAHDTLWLIHQFNVTPLEQYVASEFTS